VYPISVLAFLIG